MKRRIKNKRSICPLRNCWFTIINNNGDQLLLIVIISHNKLVTLMIRIIGCQKVKSFTANKFNQDNIFQHKNKKNYAITLNLFKFPWKISVMLLTLNRLGISSIHLSTKMESIFILVPYKDQLIQVILGLASSMSHADQRA